MLASVPNGPPPGDQTESLAARLVAQLHSAPKPRLKPVLSVSAIPRDEELPLPAFSTLTVRVRRAIYGVTALILMVIAYRTFFSS